MCVWWCWVGCVPVSVRVQCVAEFHLGGLNAINVSEWVNECVCISFDVSLRVPWMTAIAGYIGFIYIFNHSREIHAVDIYMYIRFYVYVLDRMRKKREEIYYGQIDEKNVYTYKVWTPNILFIHKTFLQLVSKLLLDFFRIQHHHYDQCCCSQ